MHPNFITGNEEKFSPLNRSRFKRRVTSVRFDSKRLTVKRSDVYGGRRGYRGWSLGASSDFYIIHLLLMNNNVNRLTILYRQTRVTYRWSTRRWVPICLVDETSQMNFVETVENHSRAGFSNTFLKKRETRWYKIFQNLYSSTIVVLALPKLSSDLGIDFILTFKRCSLSMWPPRQWFTRSNCFESVDRMVSSVWFVFDCFSSSSKLFVPFVYLKFFQSICSDTVFRVYAKCQSVMWPLPQGFQ